MQKKRLKNSDETTYEGFRRLVVAQKNRTVGNRGAEGALTPLRFWAGIEAKPFPPKDFPQIFRQSYGPENGVGVAVFEGTTQYSIRDEKFPIIFHMLRIN